jgi:hypothetical protein
MERERGSDAAKQMRRMRLQANSMERMRRPVFANDAVIEWAGGRHAACMRLMAGGMAARRIRRNARNVVETRHGRRITGRIPAQIGVGATHAHGQSQSAGGKKQPASGNQAVDIARQHTGNDYSILAAIP